MYGPWFWPPAKDAKYPPIANPYYDPNCDPDVADVLRAGADPVDTERLGGHGGVQRHARSSTARPTRPPRSTRRPTASASSTRPTTASGTCRGTSPTRRPARSARSPSTQPSSTRPRPTRSCLPTPDTTDEPERARAGSRSAPRAASCPPPSSSRPTPTTWITDPTRFDVGNVDQHSLLLAPAERADVIVDFSQYRGKTLILYNDAPAAFPARVPGLRLLHRRPGPAARRRSDDPARLRPEHPHDHAGQGVDGDSGSRLRPCRTPRPTGWVRSSRRSQHHADRQAGGVFESGPTRSSSARPPTTRPTARTSPAPAGAATPRTRRQVRRVRPDRRTGRADDVQVRHPGRATTAVALPTQGHPRRDELGELRRVGPDDGQHRPRGARGDPAAAEHHPVSVRQPGDRDCSTPAGCRAAST